MWVAAGIVVTVLMFLCAYGAMSILSTIALITKGRTTMPRKTIASLEAEIAALRTQLASKDAEIARLSEAAHKAGRRANYAEANKRPVTPISEATLTLVGEKVEARWTQGGTVHTASTHQKFTEGLVNRLLAGGCAASAIKRVGFTD